MLRIYVNKTNNLNLWGETSLYIVNDTNNKREI